MRSGILSAIEQQAQSLCKASQVQGGVMASAGDTYLPDLAKCFAGEAVVL